MRLVARFWQRFAGVNLQAGFFLKSGVSLPAVEPFFFKKTVFFLSSFGFPFLSSFFGHWLFFTSVKLFFNLM